MPYKDHSRYLDYHKARNTQRYADNPEAERERLRLSKAVSRKRRRAFLDELKDVPCADCGNRFPPECMDFDHISGDKRFNIGKSLLTSIEKVLEEIDKCEIVCSNCHRIRTRNRQKLVYDG